MRHSSFGWYSRGYLPHFDSPVHAQHVTVHLADSLPKSAIERIDQMIAALPDDLRAVERRKRLHEWIDAAHGSCILREPELAGIVQGAFRHFDGTRYRLFAWVVMPNHFHVLFQPTDAWSMADIVASWKRFTATEIKKWLRARQESGDPGSAAVGARQESGDPGSAAVGARQEAGDPGSAALPCGSVGEAGFLSGEQPIWPRDYWDRFIRNEKHFYDVVEYIHQNPVRAKLCQTPERWCYSGAHDR